MIINTILTINIIMIIIIRILINLTSYPITRIRELSMKHNTTLIINTIMVIMIMFINNLT